MQTTFNKNETVKVLKEEGLPVVKSVLVENVKAATEEFLDSIRTQTGYPCIVKPNKGSSCTGENIWKGSFIIINLRL